MMRIAICDDETIYLDEEEQYIRKIMEERGESDYCIDRYATGEQLLEQSEGGYDVVFLDISMKGINGIETARKLREQNSKGYLVFVTSYIDYAIEGYRVEPFRFIPKDAMGALMEECIDAILYREMVAKKVMEFAFVEGDIPLCADDIYYLENFSHRQIFHVLVENEMREYHLRSKMDLLEKKLEEFGFLRIGQGVIVNVCKVSSFSNQGVCIYRCNQVFHIPKGKYREIKGKYLEMRGRVR